MTRSVSDPTSPTLRSSPTVLSSNYDAAILDLDGVVYVGAYAVRGAADHIAAARSAGLRLAFVTNNASRPPRLVADHLRGLGIDADVADVVTSAQAAAGVLVDRLGASAPVVVLGGEGLREAIGQAGLICVGCRDEAVGIVSGYGPDVVWRDVMTAAIRIRAGLWWVASNTDATIPTPDGIAPGHGMLVDALRRFTGIEPVVAGKPSPPLLRKTISRISARRPLMVGDRLDTDIAAGHAIGIGTLLVMTGVTDVTELVRARPHERPHYISADLSGLTQAHPALTEGAAGEVTYGGWTAQVADGHAQIFGDGEASDWWRALAVSAWRHLDHAGEPVDTVGLAAPSQS